MYLYVLSAHMLCGLFMSICGRATFRDTFHVDALIIVAAPDFSLPANFSIWVSTQTSPTPGVFGRCVAAGSVCGSANFVWYIASRLGTSTGLPALSYIRIGAGGYFSSHVVAAVGLYFAQLPASVMVKNFCTSCWMT